MIDYWCSVGFLFMKVADVMQKQVDFVTAETSVSDVCRLIFGRGINGVPVCKGKKVIGFITERDILRKFYPSMQDYVEDPVHASDFEGMEKNISEILSLPAEKIMNEKVLTIEAKSPILRAQSLMLIYRVGRLPVVDKNGNLIGIITQGDIFKAVVGNQLPFDQEKEFYDWLAQYYDKFIDWDKRLGGELPDLVKLFQKEKVKSIIDVASSTGEHTIALAKKGFNVFGIDTSSLIHQYAEEKVGRLPLSTRERIKLLYGDYSQVILGLPKTIGAAIFMGNALSHVSYTDKYILKEVIGVLDPKNPLIIFQILNFNKIFQTKKAGLRDITLTDSNDRAGEQYAFFGFYAKEKDATLTYTRAIFHSNGAKWMFKGIKSTPILYIAQQEITVMLKKLGFSTVSFYGSMFNGPLFREKFKPLESDWLNVVAKR